MKRKILFVDKIGVDTIGLIDFPFPKGTSIASTIFDEELNVRLNKKFLSVEVDGRVMHFSTDTMAIVTFVENMKEEK